MKQTAILGSTGSIGKNAVAVLKSMPDRFSVLALTANKNAALLAQQAAELNAKYAVIADESKYAELKRLLPNTCKAMAGTKAIEETASLDGLDTLLCAIVGTGGLAPSLAALKKGRRLALASKEVMVMAGNLAKSTAKDSNAEIIPVDSEHSAIFQCLHNETMRNVQRLILTASGGPFRTFTAEMLEKVTPEQALKHPTWSMGVKVTLDSATMMNKALEMIEAARLFDVDETKIDVLVHPESRVHSLVEFKDGSLLAQLGITDMRLPIQYALTYPERVDTALPKLDLAAVTALTFGKNDDERFPSIRLARAALQAGGTMPCALNAANEVAVEKFRRKEIRFTDIWKIIEKTLEKHEKLSDDCLGNITEADAQARKTASETI